MDERERMVAGLPYRAWKDGLPEARLRAKRLWTKYNSMDFEDEAGRAAVLDELIGKHGKHFYIEAPFRCDYGTYITLGENFYANYNCTILDIAPVTIGDNVMLAPGVGIYTAGHPVHPDARRSGYEYGRPITIGDDVWIGAHSVICPGVTIGSGAVIGAGSVVTRDIPANVVAAGNPCRVLRTITEKDKKYYFRDLEFDVDWTRAEE